MYKKQEFCAENAVGKIGGDNSSFCMEGQFLNSAKNYSENT